MLLDGRNAVIYGGGGAIGGAVARAFAREGARVHLAGRTLAPLERVAEQVRAAGGVAETAVVDALDEAAVDRHADATVEGTMLKRAATLEDVGNVAVFAASDWAAP
jgi:3-oxoacyl-[acyl-carrier protein] reductase